MKRSLLFSFGILVLLATTLPLVAQAPDGSHIYFYPPVRVSNRPQNPATPTGILPAQFKAAYGFNQIPNQGQGQTIAIVDAYDDPNIESDLAVYQAQFHLTPCNFRKVKVGNPTGNPGWGLEISLDVEQACALAPQANIILVEASSFAGSDLFAAVQVASSSPYNATVISMSWGTPELSGDQQYDSYLCNIVAGNGQAVTFFAASGDAGHHVLYPASSPCVIAVGGTTLVLGQAAPLPNPLQLNYGVETAWSLSGGGVSAYESQMSWQNPACATWSTTNRCIPDVASVSVNIPVYCTYGDTGWVNADGTSIGSPDWASFLTIVNSLRAAQGKGTLSQAAQDLYNLYYSANYLTDFHDITTGSNGNCGSQCNAGPGYDLVTGIGTYQANVLAPALVALPN
jgi:subtilase family serine protease